MLTDPPSFKICKSMDIKHLNSVWVADTATFSDNWVSTSIYPCKYKFLSIWLNSPSLPTHLFWTSNSQNCIRQGVTVQLLKQQDTKNSCISYGLNSAKWIPNGANSYQHICNPFCLSIKTMYRMHENWMW
jgi:hypothetical protein